MELMATFAHKTAYILSEFVPTYILHAYLLVYIHNPHTWIWYTLLSFWTWVLMIAVLITPLTSPEILLGS